MERAIVMVLAASILLVLGCAHGPQWKAPELADGIDTGRTYAGDCVDDHFDHYFECMALQYGGADGAE